MSCNVPTTAFPKLFTVPEVCEILRLKKSAVYRLYARGELIGPIAKPVRIFESSIRNYLSFTNQKEKPQEVSPTVRSHVKVSPELRY
jgi:predicted DNA-binding transcriptional regulator AlpA